MPEDARLLDAAIDGNFALKESALKLKVSEDDLLDLLVRAKDARRIVDADTPAEGFREGVCQSIKRALKEGLNDDASIDRLVRQICYRAADFGFLLQQEDKELQDYSDVLRFEGDAG